MYKLRDLIGLPVLETKSGTQIGEVQEVFLDVERASVTGIIIASATWFAEEQGVFFGELFRIGSDAVTIRDRQVVRQLSEVFKSANIHKLKDMLDKQIFTESGQYLGLLADVVYDSITGEVREYEVSDGLVNDLLYGRMTMPLPHAQAIGEKKMIVPEAMAKLIHTDDSCKA